MLTVPVRKYINGTLGRAMFGNLAYAEHSDRKAGPGII